MNIYRYIDYRKVIQFIANERSILYNQLAQSTGIHSSYFSRVMVEKAHFSQEQLHAIGKVLLSNKEELEYLLLLGLYSSSGSNSHRQFLREKIDLIRHQRLKLRESLEEIETVETKKEDFWKYFLDPLTIKVHIFLTVNQYRNNHKLLMKKLNITEQQFSEQTQLLRQLRLIELHGGQIRILKDSLNLDENDPLSAINHSHWRQETIKNISKRAAKLSDYHFTAAFSANEEVKQIIKIKFKDFLMEIQKLIAKTEPAEDVYYMIFDLFDES